MMFVQLALIVVYTCVMLIKSCDMASVLAAYSNAEDVAKIVCATYGFGDDASGELRRIASTER